MNNEINAKPNDRFMLRPRGRSELEMKISVIEVAEEGVQVVVGKNRVFMTIKSEAWSRYVGNGWIDKAENE